MLLSPSPISHEGSHRNCFKFDQKDGSLGFCPIVQKKPQENEEKYTVGGILGSGAFAEVRFGIRKMDGLAVALKVADIDTHGPLLRCAIEKEAKILKSVEHPHIVQLFDCMETHIFGNFCEKCVCTELKWDENGVCIHCGHESYCHDYQKRRHNVIMLVQEVGLNGDLFGFLTTKGPLPEELGRLYFKQLIAAVEHCHQNGIIHRDIKPENLVLDEDYNLKLIDFGLAARCSKTGKVLQNGGVGSRPYAPPEVLYPKDEGKTSIGTYDGAPADIWSCAVTLYVLLTGYHPYRRPLLHSIGKEPHQQACPHFIALIKGKSYEDLSIHAADLIKNMLHIDPKKRLNIIQIKNHPWFKGSVKTYNEILQSMA